jgi:hypothetical protein
MTYAIVYLGVCVLIAGANIASAIRERSSATSRGEA